MIRWLAACGLIGIGLALLASGSGAAKPVAPAAGSAGSSGAMAGVARSRLASAPLQSSFIAGYLTTQTGSSSATSTFKVPKPTCGASDSGVAPGVFITGEPSGGGDAAGVLDQCIGGAVTIEAALVVGGIETNFTNPIHVGDVIEADASLGGGGTTVTVQDLTSPRNFTQSLTGSDTSADNELVGVDTTTVSGASVPVATMGPTKLTASTVGGAAIGTLKPQKVILTNGCSVLLQPGAIDSTGEIFTVSIPKVDVTAINPTADPTGTNVEIDGYGFNSTSTVKFHGVAATTVTHDSSAVMHAVVPTTATTGQITVTNTTTPIGSITSGCNFFVSPSITGMTPLSGRTGITVTINGSGLIPSPHVTLGTKTMPVTSKSATQLKVTVPNGA